MQWATPLVSLTMHKTENIPVSVALPNITDIKFAVIFECGTQKLIQLMVIQIFIRYQVSFTTSALQTLCSKSSPELLP